MTSGKRKNDHKVNKPLNGLLLKQILTYLRKPVALRIAPRLLRYSRYCPDGFTRTPSAKFKALGELLQSRCDQQNHWENILKQR